MATFLLIRHAAHGDLDRRLSGRRPGLALSNAGLAQAMALGSRLSDEALDAVFASPLERTMATAKAIAGTHGLAVQVVDALMEIDFGAWTGRDFAALDGDPAWDIWNRARATAATPGGERMADAQTRIIGWIAALAARDPGGRFAVVTHCDMIRAVVCHVLGLSLDALLRFEIGPASITRIAMGSGDARVLSLNEGGCR